MDREPTIGNVSDYDTRLGYIGDIVTVDVKSNIRIFVTK